MQQFLDLLPAVIAGLLPSLATFAMSLIVVIKNNRVNRNVIDLENTIQRLKEGNLNAKELIEESMPKLENLTQDVIKEFQELKDQLFRDLKEDINRLRQELDAKIKEQEALHHQQILKIREKAKEDVSEI